MKTVNAFLAVMLCVCLHGDAVRAAESHLGKLKADRILFLGNSITACNQGAPTTMWGLSASSPAKDYAHLLAAKIGATTGGKLTMLPTTMPLTNADGSAAQAGSNVINIADVFERRYATYMASNIRKQLDWKADIVILQFGENVPMDGFRADVFLNGLKRIVADVQASGNPHIFMPSFILGMNPTIDGMKRKVCTEDPTHRVFVDLGVVGKDAANIGAYGHPNDKGMALIADLLFKAIAAHAAAK
jgi:lysophospholipase L1-like esterase